MSTNKKNSLHSIIKSSLREEITKTMNRNPNRAFNYRQLSKQMGLKEKEATSSLIPILEEMALEGLLIETERGKYLLKPVYAYVEGIIDMTSNGAAYLMSEDFEDDIFIAPRNVRNALHGDKVRIYLYAKRPGDRRLEGEVVEVLERAKTSFAGVVQVSDRFAFLVPDGHKMSVDIFIPLQHLNGVQNGQKAVATIEDWPEESKNPMGKITEILGWPGENETEMNAILIEYGFPTRFPAHVEKEADNIPEVISGEEILLRKDFRKVLTFTIDPYDAKDFDDALSIQDISDKNTEEKLWEIGIHIADVTHYVQTGSIMEEEATERATSIYLVDRVIPMLPEKLSNQVCSLRPHEDKLCFSAVFKINEEGHVLDRWFGKTIIHSDHRFTYEEAQEVIEKNEGPLYAELSILNTLAKKLRKERFKNGAIGFEKTEIKFVLDEKGKPIGVKLKEVKDSNQLIEDFMLLANREVAEFIGKHSKENGKEAEKVFVYRVHNSPSPDRLATFAKFAAGFGYKINTRTDKDIAISLNKLLVDVAGKKEQNVLEQIAIRTMAKAIYTTKNIGHYGLAFDYYTHFTSPIRRYPDMMVHRLLLHYLEGGKSVDANFYEPRCKHSTEMEIQASEAERASIKYKQVEFLQDKIGRIFDGLISGVTERGIFVEITENKCEGMVRLRDINDDFYEYDETNYCIIGNRTGKRYQLGDAVQVKIKNADLIKKQIDMELMRSSDDNAFFSNRGFEKRDDSKNRKNKYKRW